jgi:hypothetical protein
MADTQLNPAPGAAASPASGGGRDETAASRMGIIEINDLVYKLESDLSVAINRTHKNNFFQQTVYNSTQTAICILNSGADYIDCRRSFLSLEVLLPQTPGLAGTLNNPAHPLYNGLISAFFGHKGSVLNLLDSVVVQTRSGDELSRVNDFGLLNYHLIPWTFGYDWGRTVGQELGLGSYLGGSNSNGISSTMPRVTFQIPLYLLSPVFTYSRLLPSMLMSGLKIEIRFKSMDVALQQFWENLFYFRPQPFYDTRNVTPGFTAVGVTSPPYLQWQGTEQSNLTVDRAYLAQPTSSSVAAYAIVGATGGLDPGIGAGATFALIPKPGSNSDGSYTFTLIAGNGVGSPAPWTGVFPNETGGTSGPWYQNRPAWIPLMDVLGLDVNQTSTTSEAPVTTYWFLVTAVVNATQLTVMSLLSSPLTIATQLLSGTGSTPWLNVADASPFFFNGGFYRQSYYSFQNRTSLGFNWPVNRFQFTTGTLGLQGTPYTISNPIMNLCSVQLTDSIQRHLNEYSATSGLEIVYADWDRTQMSLSGSVVPVYTEVRKSASRALMAFSVVVPATSTNNFIINSFATIGNWNNYQWQLGSLYFPQQRAESKNGSTLTTQGADDMYGITYAYAMDSFDRWHPKAAPTLVTFRGDMYPTKRADLYAVQPFQELRDDQYLNPPSAFGQAGSFCNGMQNVSVTLERSTMFDLSGIPINNSRVLAIRGEFQMPVTVPPTTTAMQYVFLKYVRLARVFLINAEVEQ